LEATCIHRGEDEVEYSSSFDYSIWRNDGLSGILESFGVQGPIVVSNDESFITWEPKRKKVINEE
jgi:hypothetical protein